jgi:hypothetical protein
MRLTPRTGQGQMTIKVVIPGVGGAGADRTGRTTDMIITRLTAMRKRSQQLLDEMTQLQEMFRQHSESNAHTPPPSLPIPPVV